MEISFEYRELLMDAKKEEVREKKDKWKELAPIVIELRDNKKFTFQEITEWLQLKDIKCSNPSVYQAYRKYKENNNA